MSKEVAATAEVTTTAEAVKTEPVATATEPIKTAEVTPEAAAVETASEIKPEDAPVVPEKYELKLSKDSLLNASDVAKIEALAKANGLTNEQAQARVIESEEFKSSFVQQQQEDLLQRSKAWVAECEADQEIGGKAYKENVELAKRALGKFADDSFRKILDESGLGNNPHLVRTFVRIGKMIGEDKAILDGKAGAATKEKRSTEDKLYGGTHKQS